MKKKQQKTKERKAATIFIVCLLGIIILIAVVAISAQVAENRKPKEEPVEQESCLKGVFYTNAADGKMYFHPLADGYCVEESNNLGECSRVDDYGACYDSNNNIIKRANLIRY